MRPRRLPRVPGFHSCIKASCGKKKAGCYALPGACIHLNLLLKARGLKMCFGNMEKTSEKTTTPNPVVTAAANQNLDFAGKLRDTGFQGYQGQQVANID